MWAAIARAALQGTLYLLSGWAVGDWFNTREKTKQEVAEAQGLNAKIDEVQVIKRTVSAKWLKWLTLFIVTMILVILGSIFFIPFIKKQRSNKKR